MKNITGLIIAGFILIFSACNNNDAVDVNSSNKDNKIPVKVEKIKTTAFTHYIETSGNVEAVDWAFISPQINGQVLNVNVEEGDKVKKGQVLVELNDAILKNNIAELQAQLDLAVTTYKKQKALYEQNIVSEMAFLQAKTQKEALEKKLAVLNEQLDYTKVKAPFDGVVENIQIKTGEIAAPGRQLMQLVNMDQMKIKADISEKYIAKIHQGDTVSVIFDNIPVEPLKCKIYRISNVINPNNRTFSIEIRLKNMRNLIKPNMTARLKITDYANDNAIVIPTIVVKKDFSKEFVFTAVKSRKGYVAKKVFVTTGMTYNGNTEITSGLNEGDLLIIEGYNEVADKSPIKILN